MNSVLFHVSCKKQPPVEGSCPENLGRFKANLFFFDFLRLKFEVPALSESNVGDGSVSYVDHC